MEVTLVVVGGKQGGKKIPVTGPKYLVGRSQDCHLRLQSGMISRKHCVLMMHGDNATIEDCGSTNGTFVNGERIEKPQDLKAGDRIKIAALEFEVHLSGVAVAATTKELQPAALATPKNIVAKASASADDVDLSDWLADDEEPAVVPPPPTRSSADTSAGRTMIDTVNIPAKGPVEPMKDAPTKEMKSGATGPGKSHPSAKPAAASTQAAAEDMLRRIISKSKS
ncbi:MAG: FHA domain-containing protein [Thermoguttaceae bacterium]